MVKKNNQITFVRFVVCPHRILQNNILSIATKIYKEHGEKMCIIILSFAFSEAIPIFSILVFGWRRKIETFHSPRVIATRNLREVWKI